MHRIFEFVACGLLAGAVSGMSPVAGAIGFAVPGPGELWTGGDDFSMQKLPPDTLYETDEDIFRLFRQKPDNATLIGVKKAYILSGQQKLGQTVECLAGERCLITTTWRESAGWEVTEHLLSLHAASRLPKTGVGMFRGSDFTFYTDVVGPAYVRILFRPIGVKVSAKFRVLTFGGRYADTNVVSLTKEIRSVLIHGRPSGILGFVAEATEDPFANVRPSPKA